MKIFTPEKTLDKFLEWFNFEKRLAFIIAFLVGIITNVVLLSIMITSPDGLWNSIIYSAGGYEITLGRWGITFFDSLRDNISILTITTIYSILIIAVTNIFLVDFFELKAKISIIITSAIMGVSPCLAMTSLYGYTADCYCFAFLFAVLSAWTIFKKNRGILEGLFSSLFIMKY